MADRFRTFRAGGPAVGTRSEIGRSLMFYAITDLVGTGIGACLFLSLPTALQDMLKTALQGAFAGSRTIFTGGWSAGYQDALVGVGIVWLLWLAGHSPAGGGLSTVVVFLRAASLGLALALVPAVYGLRGAGFDLLAVLPWNILTAGACVVAGTAAALYARQVRRNSGGPFSVRLYTLYCAVYLLCVAAVLCGGWLEAVTAGRVAALFSLH